MPKWRTAGTLTNSLYQLIARHREIMGIELRTGTVRPNRREDYCTKLAGSEPDPSVPYPIWLAFLDRVTNCNKELQAYLRRVAGYCLTGCTNEHALFFLYGTGANGKSIFINTLQGIWGDYAMTAP